MAFPPEDIDDDDERDLAILEAERLIELGRIEWDESRYAEAITCFEGALKNFRDHDHAVGVTQALGHLGNAHHAQGQPEQAEQYFHEAIQIARELETKTIEGTHLGNLGLVYKTQGKYDRAIKHFQQALTISREIGDKLAESVDLGSLGSVFAAHGHHAEAIAHFQKALEIARVVGDMRLEGAWLGNLGEVLMQSNESEEARTALKEAIRLGDKTFPVAAGSYRGSLALLLAREENFEEVYSLLRIGESQVRNSPEEHAKFLCKKGQVFLLREDPLGAERALEEAQAIAAQLNVSKLSEIGQAIGTLSLLLR